MTTTGALSAITRRSLTDQVVDALVQLILDDGMREGDPLPSTAELSERFEVSRTVIREALATLNGQGVLHRSQGRECVVATPGLTDLTRLLQFRIRHDEVGPLDVLDCRMGLEVTAARLAARRAGDEAVAAMASGLDELAAARTDKAYHQADIALHRAIAAGSGNLLLVLILDAMVDALHEVRVQATRNRRERGLGLEEVVEEHRRIVEAITAGNPEAAADAMRAHLQRTADEFGPR